ncbi:unnamed protein product [Brassica rapa]|uniref:Uncharacterized protein n=1 Tax=Brassica campestris TaxID=3711 RepID=A0A3P6CE08_BRACM|nr:unnamed protein product [Brassica rapa]VDD11254.1 unnamed protein product [Brassica rapa]
MAYRNSKMDKGKWVADSVRQAKRPPVKIPAVDTSARIEEHKLTLIGRVTNPSVQKTIALDFDVDRGRIRVLVNGLKPLEMFLDISLAGEIKQVELEY